MVDEEFRAEQRLRFRLHGFDVPGESGAGVGVPADTVFDPDLLEVSPLWQSHRRALSRDATRRRN